MGKLKNAIGIFGGSFDPPHRGHLKIAKICLNKFNFKKIYWIVSKKNPFKKKPLYSLRKRLTSAKKIIKNIKNIKILYLDDIVKSSRTIDIIQYLIKKKKYKNLHFIIGSDILTEFERWKSWKKIVKYTKLIVFSRKGYDRKCRETIVAKYLNKKNKILFIKNEPIQISSSILRKKLIKNN